MERPRYFRVAAALILLLGAALRLWQLGAASLWIDEVWTQLSTEGSIHQTIVRTLELGNQMPVYFLTLHFFPRDTDFLLRVPSVLFGIIGVALAIMVALRLYKDYNFALLAGALFAFNPYFIWLSRTARYYSLLFIFSLLASYYFLILLRNDRNRRVWVLFILSSMATYMTHYFGAANPIAQYVLFSFLLSRKRRFFRRWILAQMIAVLPLLVWMFLLSQQEVLSIGIAWIPKPSWKDPIQTLCDMTVGYDGGVRLDGSVRWYVPFGLLAAAVGLVLGIYDALQNRRTNPVNFFWLWLLVTPLVLVFVLSVVLRSLYVDRYFVVVLPAILLLMLVGWQRLSRIRKGLGTALAAIFIIVNLLNVFVTLDRDENHVQDWRSAAGYVAQAQQPGDALLFETPVDLIAFARYFDDVDMERAWLLDAPNLEEQYDQPVQRVWVIYRNPKADVHRQGVPPVFDPFAKSDSPLYGWIHDHRVGVVSEAQKEFNGITVLLVETGDEFARGEQ